MKQTFYTAVLVFAVGVTSLLLHSCIKANAEELQSPAGKLTVRVGVVKGKPFYRVERDTECVIDTSFLSLQLGKFHLGELSEISDIEIYHLESSAGEKEFVNEGSGYNRMVVNLKETGETPLIYSVEFRAYDDGISLRYIIPAQENVSSIESVNEDTEFNITEDAVTWSVPLKLSGEECYFENSLLTKLDTVRTPLTMKVSDKLYMTIKDIPEKGYSPLALYIDKGSCRLHSYLIDDKKHSCVKRQDSLNTAWRAVIITDTPGGLVLSHFSDNLEGENIVKESGNEPLPLSLLSDPRHSCIIPFTGHPEIEINAAEGRPEQATLAKKLAMSVVYSNVLNYEIDALDSTDYPDFELFKSLPATWDKSVVPDAKIGQYLAIAHKMKEDDNWYVGAITNEQPYDSKIRLDFLNDEYEYEAQIYADGEKVNYLTNPEDLKYTTCKVDSKTVLPIHLAGGGGTAMIIRRREKKI